MFVSEDCEEAAQMLECYVEIFISSWHDMSYPSGAAACILIMYL